MSEHTRRPDRDECAWCGEVWPCEVEDLRGDVQDLRHQVKTLRAEVEASKSKRRLDAGQRAMLLRLVEMLDLFFGDRASEVCLGVQANGGMSLVLVPPARDLLTSLLLERARLDLSVAEVRS